MPTTSDPMARLSDEELTALAAKSHEQNSLTREQRALIHLDARTETRRALRVYRRNAIIAFVILLAGIGSGRHADVQGLSEARQAVVASGNSVAMTSCNRDFRTALKQRIALQRVQDRDEDGPVITKEERQSQINALTPLPDCRTAKNALTDDPDAEIVMPRPLHEGLVDENNKLVD